MWTKSGSINSSQHSWYFLFKQFNLNKTTLNFCKQCQITYKYVPLPHRSQVLQILYHPTPLCHTINYRCLKFQLTEYLATISPLSFIQHLIQSIARREGSQIIGQARTSSPWVTKHEFSSMSRVLGNFRSSSSRMCN